MLLAVFSSLISPLLSLPALAPAPPQQQATADVQISYTLAQAEATVGEPVLLKFSVRNTLSETVIVDPQANYNGYGNFRVTVARPDGRTIDAPTPGVSELVKLRPLRVEPNGSATRLLLLNKWVDFDIPGRYTFRLEMVDPVTTADGVRLPYSTAGSVDVDVGPRDAARLQKICADLLKKVMDADSFSQSEAPAEELSYIRDPVAVEYMSAILVAKKGLEVPMARGLRRVGDVSAVDALIADLTRASDDAREVIRGALANIAAHTADSKLKDKIKDVLHRSEPVK